MKILAVGDVYGVAGIACIEQRLRALRNQEGADLVIVNGENCAPGNGPQFSANKKATEFSVAF